MSEFENMSYHRVIIENQNKQSKEFSHSDESVVIFMDSNGRWHKYEVLVDKPKKNWILRLFEKLTRYKR